MNRSIWKVPRILFNLPLPSSNPSVDLSNPSVSDKGEKQKEQEASGRQPSLTLGVESKGGEQSTESQTTIANIYLRNAVIAPKDIGTLVKIHTGRGFIHKRITEHLVGYKFGAFAHTKKRVFHKRKKKKK